MKENDNRINMYKKIAAFKPRNVNEIPSDELSINKDLNKKANSTTNSQSFNQQRTSFSNTINERANINNPIYGKNNTENEQKITDAKPITDAIKNQGLIKITKTDDFDKNQKDSVYRRVAKFLLLIGIDEAAKIIPHLTQEQTEKIIPEIASIRSVDPDEATVILAEFQTLIEKSRDEGGVTTAKTILTKAFGEKRAEQMIQKSVPFPNGKPFDYLQEMDGERVFILLKEESAAVKALVLSYLKPKVAADVINRLDIPDKTDVIKRLAKLTSISPEILKRVDSAMHEKVLSVSTTSADKIDGRGALADILKKMSVESEKNILSILSTSEPDLSTDLRERLFTIDDVISSDDRVVQEKLQTLSDTEIAILISAKDQSFRNKILSNVSKGRGDLILEEEQLKKPILKKDSDFITNEFITFLRIKWEKGELRIKGRDDDEYVM